MPDPIQTAVSVLVSLTTTILVNMFIWMLVFPSLGLR